LSAQAGFESLAGVESLDEGVLLGVLLEEDDLAQEDALL
jgi:hypothetical protein